MPPLSSPGILSPRSDIPNEPETFPRRGVDLVARFFRFLERKGEVVAHAHSN